jgi:glycosyltransferase involved in cell wall biosynthesis
VNFSIVVCTYNPNIEIFNRLLDSVFAFSSLSPLHEVIIVDNNSMPSLINNLVIEEFLLKKKNSRLIREEIPGLTSARLTGIKAAKYEWIIFFDDDNEPNAEYLINAAYSISLYPDVGIWGPGNVNVHFLGIKNQWVHLHKNLFQERNEDVIRYGNKTSWQEYYPYGTGLIGRKEILESYVFNVENNIYTLSDRKGKSLSSGGDVQIVYTAIKNGFSVGVNPSIKLNHLIDSSKAKLSYLRSQQYYTATASILAYNQVFTHNLIVLKKIRNRDVLLRVYTLSRIYWLNLDRRSFQLLLASKIGELNAMSYASGQKKPILLRLYESIINV